MRPRARPGDSRGRLEPGGDRLGADRHPPLRGARQADCACGALHVLATAAVRDASNGPDFIASVEAIAGVKAMVLSGAEEARLSAQGVLSGFHQPDGVVGDLGGGSIEVVDIRDERTGTGETFPLGGLQARGSSPTSR